MVSRIHPTNRPVYPKRDNIDWMKEFHAMLGDHAELRQAVDLQSEKFAYLVETREQGVASRDEVVEAMGEIAHQIRLASFIAGHGRGWIESLNATRDMIDSIQESAETYEKDMQPIVLGFRVWRWIGVIGWGGILAGAVTLWMA